MAAAIPPGLRALYRILLFVALGAAVSTSGWINVRASDGTTEGVVLGLLAPGAYLTCAAIGELIPRRNWTDVGFYATVVVALLTMGISAFHCYELAIDHGQPWPVALAIAGVTELSVIAIISGQRRLGGQRTASEAGPSVVGALRGRLLDAVTPAPPPPAPPAPAIEPEPAQTTEEPARRRAAFRVAPEPPRKDWDDASVRTAVEAVEGWESMSTNGLATASGVPRTTLRRYLPALRGTDEALA